MSTRISERGRLFGIMAGLGGASMIGGASLSWRQAIFATPQELRMSDASLLGWTLAVLVIALVVAFFVIANYIYSHDSL